MKAIPEPAETPLSEAKSHSKKFLGSAIKLAGNKTLGMRKKGTTSQSKKMTGMKKEC